RPSRFSARISRPSRDPGSQRSRDAEVEIQSAARGGARSAGWSAFAVSVTDAIEGFDRVEIGVDLAELLAHALDVAVDRAVVDVDLIVVGGVHQVVAALHEARPL